MNESLDVVIVGGGPAGLSAGLALGRARRKVAILDSDVRRNARAEHLHNFVTRDGITPERFREIGHEQLSQYPTVSHHRWPARSIERVGAQFRVHTESGSFDARRVLLCTGLADEPLLLEGADELWGHAIFQCPYCHGWEHRDRRWGYLLDDPERSLFALMLASWTSQVTVYLKQPLALPHATLERLLAAGVRVESRSVSRLLVDSATDVPRLGGVVLADDTVAACDVLFAHPAQKQVPLVSELGVAMDESGFVTIDPMTRETSIPGVYAAGDLTTRMQGAIFAAAAGTQAAAMIHHDLAMA